MTLWVRDDRLWSGMAGLHKIWLKSLVFRRYPSCYELSADDAFGSKRCAICSYPKELADQRPADKTRLTIVLLERIMV